MSDVQLDRAFGRSVATIIVNYKTAKLVIDGLRSLEQTAQRHDDFSVIVVDNCSQGDDVELLSSALKDNQWQGWVTLIAHDKNGGFAAGNNVALRHLFAQQEQPGFIYLLNPDAYIHEGAVEKLAFFLQENPRAGLVGSRVVDAQGEVQRTAFRFPSLAGEFERAVSLGFISRLLSNRLVAPPPLDETHRTDWVEGSSLMIRKEVFDDIGLFDEGYFLYKEEVDFMLHAARADWPTYYLNSACATHLDGQSTKINECQTHQKPVPRYIFDSWLRYYARNHGKTYAFASGLAWLSGELIYRTHRLILQRPIERPAKEVSSFISYCMIPLILGNVENK